MKIRSGFVSNSSSTSFVCEVCGESETAWDSCSYNDFGFTECINGHLFCTEHVEDCDFEIYKKEMIEFISDENNERRRHNESVKDQPKPWLYKEEDMLDVSKLEELNTEEEIRILICEYDYENGAGVPASSCPICSFKASGMTDISRYLFKEYGVTRETVFEEVKKNNKRRKKLYDFEYVNYVYKQFNLTEESFLKNLKDQFGTYTKFQQHLRGVK